MASHAYSATRARPGRGPRRNRPPRHSCTGAWYGGSELMSGWRGEGSEGGIRRVPRPRPTARGARSIGTVTRAGTHTTCAKRWLGRPRNSTGLRQDQPTREPHCRRVSRDRTVRRTRRRQIRKEGEPPEARKGRWRERFPLPDGKGGTPFFRGSFFETRPFRKAARVPDGERCTVGAGSFFEKKRSVLAAPASGPGIGSREDLNLPRHGEDVKPPRRDLGYPGQVKVPRPGLGQSRSPYEGSASAGTDFLGSYGGTRRAGPATDCTSVPNEPGLGGPESWGLHRTRGPSGTTPKLNCHGAGYGDTSGLSGKTLNCHGRRKRDTSRDPGTRYPPGRLGPAKRPVSQLQGDQSSTNRTGRGTREGPFRQTPRGQ